MRVRIAIAPVNQYTHVQIWRARGWSYPHRVTQVAGETLCALLAPARSAADF